MSKLIYQFEAKRGVTCDNYLVKDAADLYYSNPEF